MLSRGARRRGGWRRRRAGSASGAPSPRCRPASTPVSCGASVIDGCGVRVGEVVDADAAGARLVERGRVLGLPMGSPKNSGTMSELVASSVSPLLVTAIACGCWIVALHDRALRHRRGVDRRDAALGELGDEQASRRSATARGRSARSRRGPCRDDRRRGGVDAGHLDDRGVGAVGDVRGLVVGRDDDRARLARRSAPWRCA